MNYILIYTTFAQCLLNQVCQRKYSISWYNGKFCYLLEARDDVPCNGANQSCDVVHEALRKTVLPGRLQTVSEEQVVDYTFNLKAAMQ